MEGRPPVRLVGSKHATKPLWKCGEFVASAQRVHGRARAVLRPSEEGSDESEAGKKKRQSKEVDFIECSCIGVGDKKPN